MGSNPTDEVADAAAAIRDSSPPWPTDDHARACRICCHPDQDAIEARFMAWEPRARLCQDYGITVPQLEAHAAVFLLHLKRCAEPGSALSRLIAAGVQAAEQDGATPRLALDAIAQLQAGQDRQGENVQTGASVTYEERIRRVQLGGAAPALLSGPAKGTQGAATAKVARTAGGSGDPQTVDVPAERSDAETGKR